MQLPQEQQQIIRIISFDMDGCLFPFTPFYSQKLPKTKPPIVEANKNLLMKIKNLSTQSQIEKTVIMLGSNRQCLYRDLLNTTTYQKRADLPYAKKRAISSYIALEQIKNYLNEIGGKKIELDKYLLNDTFNNFTPGTSYDEALKKINGKNAEELSILFNTMWADENIILDEYKITILYAQIHKAALDNPGKKIIFDFYDDRQDILDHLYKFYNENRDLVPSNVCLTLNKYNGEVDNNNKKTLQGTARNPDDNFGGTIKQVINNENLSSLEGNIDKVIKKEHGYIFDFIRPTLNPPIQVPQPNPNPVSPLQDVPSLKNNERDLLFRNTGSKPIFLLPVKAMPKNNEQHNKQLEQKQNEKFINAITSLNEALDEVIKESEKNQLTMTKAISIFSESRFGKNEYYENFSNFENSIIRANLETKKKYSILHGFILDEIERLQSIKNASLMCQADKDIIKKLISTYEGFCILELKNSSEKASKDASKDAYKQYMQQKQSSLKFN